MIKPAPTVFIVDDDENMRNSLSRLCKSVHLNAELYAFPQDFLENCDPDRHGCLVIDVRMPGMSGLNLLLKLRERGVTAPVIMITGYGDVQTAVQAMKGGAVEFLEKPLNDQEFLDCIHQCIELDYRTSLKSRHRNEIMNRLSRLTAREREVMDLIVAGKSNKVVAAGLGISCKTVEAHRSQVMTKMQAESVADLVRMCLELQPVKTLPNTSG